MSSYFLDSSALVKRYVTENGSHRIRALTHRSSGNVVVISDLATVEVFSALARLERHIHIPAGDARHFRTEFLSHVDDEYLTVPIDNKALKSAQNLLLVYPLRTLDAIQLACALSARAIINESLTFVCADNNLRNAAASELFTTENPLSGS